MSGDVTSAALLVLGTSEVTMADKLGCMARQHSIATMAAQVRLHLCLGADALDAPVKRSPPCSHEIPDEHALPLPRLGDRF
eukprot:365665-Chlamydomonas_euryale.AAC.6